MRPFQLACAGLLLAAASHLDATVRPASLLTDHMVMQRGLPVHVWGKADPGEHVSAEFRGAKGAATADDVGRWSIYLPPGEAGGPFTLTITASNSITLKDVLVGDVWVASGQSNMELPMTRTDNAATAIAAATYPNIRLYKVDNKVADYPLDDVAGKGWTDCNPETVASFSAVAYYFARNIQQKLQVPMGLIESNWGGTPADAWTSLDALGSKASLMPVFAEWARMMRGQATTLAKREQQLTQWQAEVTAAKAAGKPAPDKPWVPNDNYSWKPAGLYNAMIAPLTPLPIRGAIWYQGESNASRERAPLYAELFQTMIQDWRHAWGVGDFPFLFVQLANFTTGPDSKWPDLREAQRQTLALANTGMAVTIDIGNPTDIHPKDKEDVGVRLALAARALTYGEKVEYSGPLFREATPEGATLRAWFDHADGLRAKGATLTGFEIAGADHKFVPAEAKIDGTSVIVSNPGVTSPVYVRYAWADNPACDLVNGSGLPASPFHSGL